MNEAKHVCMYASKEVTGLVSEWLFVRALLSPWLFNVHMDGIMREVRERTEDIGESM